MSAAGFKRSMPLVLKHEGGKVDDPRDPGGRTNQGVTQRVYNGYRVKRGLPVLDVYDMEPAERDAIYKLQYWDAIHGDQLPDGVDYVVFDGAVNSGPSQSIKWLQRALGNLPVDGQIGQATLAAVAEHGDPDALVEAICDRRMAFLQALKTWGTFGKGWSRRVASVRSIGRAWASGRDPVPLEKPEPTRKAPVSDAKKKPGKGVADATTGGGIVTGGLGTAIETAKEALEPYIGASPIVRNIVVGMIVLGLLLTIGGMAYRWWAARQTAKLDDALDLGVPA